MLSSSRRRSVVRGFSLIEVMVAVVVFTVGLLGLGALIGTSVRSNHVGMMHTNASFLAESIFDRMRANIQGVWVNAYDGTFSGIGAPPAACTNAAPCNAVALAASDSYTWGLMVSEQLPAGAGTILCTRRAAVPLGPQMQTVPIYDGDCRITLTWNEVGEDITGVNAQTLEWVVQP